jgi:hypothetical protein
MSTHAAMMQEYANSRIKEIEMKKEDIHNFTSVGIALHFATAVCRLWIYLITLPSDSSIFSKK